MISIIFVFDNCVAKTIYSLTLIEVMHDKLIKEYSLSGKK